MSWIISRRRVRRRCALSLPNTAVRRGSPGALGLIPQQHQTKRKNAMNFLKGLFGGNNATSSSESSAKLNLDWKTYRAGELDKAGRTITKVHAVDADYVIYFSGCELYYETTLALRKDLGNADAALAQINRLLDAHPKKDTREYNINLST